MATRICSEEIYTTKCKVKLEKRNKNAVKLIIHKLPSKYVAKVKSTQSVQPCMASRRAWHVPTSCKRQRKGKEGRPFPSLPISRTSAACKEELKSHKVNSKMPSLAHLCYTLCNAQWPLSNRLAGELSSQNKAILSLSVWMLASSIEPCQSDTSEKCRSVPPSANRMSTNGSPQLSLAVSLMYF